MHLTRESEYALLALGYLAELPRETEASVGEIAEARGLPVHFLSKIFQKLGKAGLVQGDRGRGRGYRLSIRSEDLRIGDVLAAVEPPENLDTCLLWQGYCGDRRPCPLHHRLKDLHRQLREVVDGCSLAEYLEKAGHTCTRAEATRFEGERGVPMPGGKASAGTRNG